MAVAEPIHHFGLCGWHVASALALPELGAWTGDGGTPDIVIAFGDVPTLSGELVLETPAMQVDTSGRARLHAPGIADYLVEDGARVTIATQLPPDAADIRLFLCGTVFAILCHQRGVLPIHAATVEIDGEAVMLAGPSGAGKSTFAAAFWRRGFRLLGDDVAPVSLAPGPAGVLPGFRRVRLWEDSVEAFDWRSAPLERCREGLEKFSRTLDKGFVSEPLRSGAVVHLVTQAANVGGIAFARLRGRAAFDRLRREIHRGRTLTALIGEPATVARTLEAASRIPRHFTLKRALRYEDLDATIDLLVDTVRSSR